MKSVIKNPLSLLIFAGFFLAVFGCGRQQAKTDFLLVDDFDDAYASNHLGGTYGIVAEGGEASFDFVRPPVPYLTHSAFLNIQYEFRKKGSAYAFLWMKLGKRGESYDYSEYADLKGFSFLVLKYRSVKSGSFKIEIHEDRNNDKRFDIRADHSSFVYTDSGKQVQMEDGWTKVLIPLKRFAGVKDWSKIIELVFVFERERLGEAGSVQLDDVLFLKKNFKTTPTAAPSFLTDIQVRFNGRPPANSQATQNDNQWFIKYKPGPDFPFLESLRLELKVPDSSEWMPVFSTFIAEQKEIIMSWDAATFSPPESLSFRLVGEDSFGRTQVLAGPFDGITVPGLTDDEFLDLVSRKAFQYFVENQDPKSGLFYDTTGGGDLSTGVTGFGLAALVIGVDRGWMERGEAERRIKLCLQSSLKIPGKEGLQYHFLRDTNLERADKSEVSTVDSALLIAGALTAGEYFGGDIKKLSNQLYEQANWDYYLEKNPDEGHAMQFRHGWTPEDGLVDSFWDYFTDEALVLDLIGISSPTHPVPPEVFYSFQRREGSYKGDEKPFVISWHGSLFSYQYANAFYRFHNIVDKQGMNWFENGKRATLSNRNFVMDNSTQYRTYGEDLWGITSMRIPEGYVMHYGPLPNGQNKAEHDGTVSPSGAGGSIPFTPYLSLRVLKHMYANYPQAWGIYGLKDSLNLDKNWTSPIYYGLGEGILLIGIENFRTGLIWDQFMKNEWIQQGLKKAEFVPAPPAELKPVDIETLEKQILQQPEAARLPKLYSFLQEYPMAYEDAAAFADRITAKFIGSEDPKILVWLARIQIQLIELLQQNDFEIGRKYLKFAPERKAAAVQYLDRALKPGATTDFERLEIYKRKLEVLEKIQAFKDLPPTRLELAKVFKDGMKRKAYNLNWALKWLDGLDEKSAAEIRKSFLKDLPAAEKQNLNELLQLRVRDAFEKKELRKAGETSEELIQFMEAPEERRELIAFLARTAQAFSSAKKYTEAERFYRKILEQYGDTSDREKFLPAFASMLEAKGEKERGYKEYQLFVDLFPQSPKVPEALTRMANIKSGLGDREKAIALYKQVGTQYSKTVHAQESTYLLGMLYFHANRYKEAVVTWEGFLKQYPDSRYVRIVRDYLEKADNKQGAAV